MGIGTKTTSTSTALPNFNLHLHETTDYSVTFPAQPPIYDINNNLLQEGTPAYTENYGKTSRFGFTNSTTGLLATDETVLRMSNNNFVLQNQEANGSILFKVNNAMMQFLGNNNQIWVGGSSTVSNAIAGKLNIYAIDGNVLYIRSMNNAATSGGFR